MKEKFRPQLWRRPKETWPECLKRYSDQCSIAPEQVDALYQSLRRDGALEERAVQNAAWVHGMTDVEPV